VVTVTMCRPERRNAQTPATWVAFAAIGAGLPAGTRVVVLRGDGPSFSAGIDVRLFRPEGLDGETPFADISGSDPEVGRDLIATFQEGFTWWHDRDDVITIAAVQGPAVGAGFQLTLSCDLRVAAPDARFSMRETTLGLVPDLTGTHPLVAAVGFARALDICVTGRWIGAQEALTLGILTAVSAADGLDAAVQATVAAILAAPERAVRDTKAVLRHAIDATVSDQRRFERETQTALIRSLVGHT
jgi:enoyl-CoA hydratase/carnithine racemase